MTLLSGTEVEPALRTFSHGSLWSALAPDALVRYWTTIPSAAADAEEGRAARPVAASATAAAEAAAVRSLDPRGFLCAVFAFLRAVFTGVFLSGTVVGEWLRAGSRCS